MKQSQILTLSLRQTRTDLRSPAWRTLLIALLMVTTLASFLALLGNQLEQGLSRQSAAMLGADLVISDSRVPEAQLSIRAEELGLEITQVVQFPTMVSTEEQMLLSSVRAVISPYPLRGELVTEPPQSALIPERGTAWAEPQLLQRLNIQVGDQLDLGYSQFKVTASLTSSPDRGTGFRSFSPQLVINRADLEATGVIQPGSRIGYRTLFSGPEASIKTLQTQLEQQLEPQQRLWSVFSDQPMAEGAMRNASGYLRLAALFGLLLCGLMVSLCLRRYTGAQFNRCALLKCLGMKQQQLLQLYLLQLLFGWLLTALIGSLLSVGLLKGMAILLSDVLPAGLPAANPVWYLSGPLLSLALLLVLGCAPLLQMSGVQVMSLLRHDQLSLPPLSLGARLLIALLLILMLILYLGSAVNAIVAMVALTLLILITGYIGSLLLSPTAALLAQRFRLGRLLRYRLRQQRQWHRLQLGIMSMLLALLSSLYISQNELVSRWQDQLPADAPNQFIVNIQPWELEPLSNALHDAGIDNRLYPMIRGRLTEINQQSPQQTLNPEQLKHNALNRELNLSWSATAPEHNELVAGEWWKENSKQALISVEQELAGTLGLKLGDQLGFEIAGEKFSAVISNIRHVEWRSFRPNFYIIFSPGVLENYPQTYITSFRSDNQPQLARNLLTEFPALTLIDVTQWIEQADRLIDQLIQAASLILLLTIGAGLLLVQLLLYQELEQRRHENALLQVLGTTGQQTRSLDLLEFGLLGALAGLLGAFISELITSLIGMQILDLTVRLHPWLWLMLPLTGILIFTLAALTAHQPSGYRQLRDN